MAALQRLRFFPNFRESRHHVRVNLLLGVIGFSQHLHNDHTDNGRVDREYLIRRLLAKESVQRLLQSQMFLEEILLDSIIYVLVLLPALQMLFAMVLSVAVWQKGNLGYLVWIVRP